MNASQWAGVMATRSLLDTTAASADQAWAVAAVMDT